MNEYLEEIYEKICIECRYCKNWKEILLADSRADVALNMKKKLSKFDLIQKSNQAA